MPVTDARVAGRVVAGVLLAPGEYTAAEVARVTHGLAALGRPPLAEADLVSETPELLAPRVPLELRAGLLDLMYDLAGDEPIRRRLADAYAALWHDQPEGPAPRRAGSPMVRWLIGKLPRHQSSQHQKETAMTHAPYRSDDAPQLAPVERSPLRDRVARIRDEYRQVVEAVEQVIVGKRDVIERVLVAMAARGHVLLVDVPGVGKTQLCKAIAAAIETRFGRIQFTPDLLPMDITGSNVFDLRDRSFTSGRPDLHQHPARRRDQPRDPEDPVGAARGVEERSVTVDGVTYRVEEPFQVLATMNPSITRGRTRCRPPRSTASWSCSRSGTRRPMTRSRCSTSTSRRGRPCLPCAR